MKDKLKIIIDDAIQKLETAQSNFINNRINTINIDEVYFNEKFMNIDITDTIERFKQLKTIKNPVLYWFELNSSENNITIREKYIAYREPMKKNFTASNYRNTSSYKSKPYYDTKILYVGKVEKGF